MKQVRLTAAALQDLKDIYSYIAEDNAEAATRFLDRLQRRWQGLAESPGTGRQRDDLEPGLRTGTEGNYVIFYRQQHNGIELVRVMRGSRNIEEIFGKPFADSD